MKHCNYCGKDFTDEFEMCPIDGRRLVPIADAEVPGEFVPEPVPPYQISPAEKRFWERMTFRQFAILMVRLQAVWLLFNIGLDSTSLLSYFNFSSPSASYFTMSSAQKFTLFLLILRIILRFALIVFLIQKAEVILSWLVKDFVQEQPAVPEEKTPDAKAG